MIDRIIIMKPVVGLTMMQICCHEDVQDKEILAFCNEHNPSGVKNGWCEVIRDGKQNPIRCENFLDRIHYLITC